MDGCIGGSSTPSYREVVVNKSKASPDPSRGNTMEGGKSGEKEIENNKEKEKDGTKDKEENDKKQGTKDRKQQGPCKPKVEVTPRDLQTWIRYHWKPKGSIDLHLGSKGFFTVVFANIEDKGRVFERGPYFYVAAGLYMRPWMMNFVPERETFTSIPVWVRIYLLPLDYWKIESLTTIGNKLGRYVKTSKATRRGKYTSFAKICVEMDISGALPNEVILEVYDEEWVQVVDYEHIPFRCRKCHEHGHLLRDYPISKAENKSKPITMKETKGFHKATHKGKNGKIGPKHHQSGDQKGRPNQFHVLEEEEDAAVENLVMKDGDDKQEKEEEQDQEQVKEKKKDHDE
eukprot:PITA_26030